MKFMVEHEELLLYTVIDDLNRVVVKNIEGVFKFDGKHTIKIKYLDTEYIITINRETEKGIVFGKVMRWTTVQLNHNAIVFIVFFNKSEGISYYLKKK